MKSKIKETIKLIFPYKRINIFVITLIFLGIILGATFTTMTDINDKKLIIEKIESFINNINNNSLDTLKSFKNSLSINFTYLIFIFISGMTIIGIISNLLILFLKGFIIGFSLASFIITYSYKGIFLSTFYIIFGQLLNIIIICSMTIYGLIFSYKFIQVIFKNRNTGIKHFFKGYFIIFLILTIISIISSISEIILFPSIIKLIIKLFI